MYKADTTIAEAATAAARRLKAAIVVQSKSFLGLGLLFPKELQLRQLLSQSGSQRVVSREEGEYK